MRVLVAPYVVKSLILAVGLSCLAGIAAAQNESAPGQYKIAVVDRKKVFDEYNKKNAKWEALEAKRKAAEDALNKTRDQLQAQDASFRESLNSLSEEQRAQRESEMKRKLRDLQNDVATKQEELSKEGELIIKEATTDINNAIQQIGREGQYHLILEADTAISSVVYYATALDITPQVIEYVNNGGGTTAAAAPAASNNEGSSGNRRRR